MLLTKRSAKAFKFGERGGQSYRFDADLEDHPEVLAKHAGPIMNEIAAAAQELVQAVGQVASHLLHPQPMRFRDDPGDVYLPRAQSKHEGNMVTDQPQRRPHFHAETSSSAMWG